MASQNSIITSSLLYPIKHEFSKDATILMKQFLDSSLAFSQMLEKEDKSKFSIEQKVREEVPVLVLCATMQELFAVIHFMTQTGQECVIFEVPRGLPCVATEERYWMLAQDPFSSKRDASWGTFALAVVRPNICVVFGQAQLSADSSSVGKILFGTELYKVSSSYDPSPGSVQLSRRSCPFVVETEKSSLEMRDTILTREQELYAWRQRIIERLITLREVWENLNPGKEIQERFQSKFSTTWDTSIHKLAFEQLYNQEELISIEELCSIAEDVDMEGLTMKQIRPQLVEQKISGLVTRANSVAFALEDITKRLEINVLHVRPILVAETRDTFLLETDSAYFSQHRAFVLSNAIDWIANCLTVTPKKYSK